MPKEIEKKFLLKNDSWRNQIIKTTIIKQSYMYINKGVVRIRIIDDIEAFITLKSNNVDITRNEYEYSIPLNHANEMIVNLCDSAILHKKRHHLKFCSMEWVIDEFLDNNAPLITAEIELESPDQEFNTPKWLGEDISLDSRFYNSNLILKPYTSW